MKEDPLQTCPEIVRTTSQLQLQLQLNLDERKREGERYQWSTYPSPCSCSCSCFAIIIIILLLRLRRSSKILLAPSSNPSSWPWCSSRSIDLDYPHQSRSIRPVTSTDHESCLRPRPSQHSALLKPGSTGPHTSTEPRYHSFNLAYRLWTSTACSTPINFSALGQLTYTGPRDTTVQKNASVPSQLRPIFRSIYEISLNQPCTN